MGQKKLIRFAELVTFPNVLQYPKDMAGTWSKFFGNDHPITLELACGKGEYTIGLSRKYKERNFIGIDTKGNRIWVGARTALRENLTNAAFIRSHIDKLTDYFAPGEISEIWLPFPDPQLRGSKLKKRLTHPKYLRLYQSCLANGGRVHLKTDSTALYNFTKQVINLYNLESNADIDDLHSYEHRSDELNIKTHYESLDIAQSGRIHYLCFVLPADTLPDKDKELKQLNSEEESE